jgi:Domain of unknown function (DUF4252)
MRVAVASFALWAAPAAYAGDGRLAMPEIRALESKAAETVSISLDAPLMRLAASFLDTRKPEDAATQQLISSITGIYVRSFTFRDEYAVPRAELDALHQQLVAPAWTSFVHVKSQKDHTDVEIFVALDGTTTKGVAIVAIEPREFTIVNLVGSVDLKKLHDLEGHFGIPKLRLDERN